MPVVYGVAVAGPPAAVMADGMTMRHATGTSKRHTTNEAASLSRLMVHSRLVHAVEPGRGWSG
jgi:phage terminase large subunit-like protein